MPERDNIHIYSLARMASGSLVMGHVSHSSHSSHSSGTSHYSHASHASHTSHASHVSGGPTVNVGGGSGSPSGGGGGTSTTEHKGRPDLRISRPGGTLVGNDVYGSAASQSVAQTSKRGRKVTYWISVQNDADVPDQFRLSGPRSSQGVTVKYLTPKGVDVTKRVAAGTFRTPQLTPKASYRIKVVVKVPRHASTGANVSATVKAYSTKTPSRQDAVAFVIDVI